jgi:hypothetical protein
VEWLTHRSAEVSWREKQRGHYENYITVPLLEAITEIPLLLYRLSIWNYILRRTSITAK